MRFVYIYVAEYNTTELREYYVKWQSLPYAEATWEDAALIERKWPENIREFREREDSKRTPSKLCKALKYRPKFVQLQSQPSYMGNHCQVCRYFWLFFFLVIESESRIDVFFFYRIMYFVITNCMG